MLSVIIPVYNGKKYLQGIVEAFSVQELPELELVFVDDGSTDGSFEAMQQLRHPTYIRINAVRQRNKGVSAARNHGIRAAQGEWIAFMDADDRVTSDFGAVLSRQMQRQDTDVFVYHHRAIDRWEDPSLVDERPAEFVGIPAEQLAQELMRTPTRFGVYDLMIRRQFLMDNDLLFAEGYPYYEDYEFLYRLYLTRGRFRYSDHALYDYRANHVSAMSAFSDERVRCLELYERLKPQIAAIFPALVNEFERWAQSRIYWSVLWQACVVKPTFDAFHAFAAQTGAGEYMARLKDFPEKRVSWSARLYGISPRGYRLLARLAAGRRQKRRLRDMTPAVENRGAAL